MTAVPRRDGPYRLALVGVGRFAHLYHVPPLLAEPRARLAIVCDPASSAPTRELARATGAVVSADIASALEVGVCDAVIVSTPHAYHADHVRAALLAGKHVLVDKPFVLASAEADELATLARERGLVGLVAFQRRLDPAYRAARRLVREGHLGELRFVESVQLGGDWVIVPDGNVPRDTGPARPAWYVDPRVAGGGVLMGRGAHVADAVPWLIGRAPARVRALLAPSPADGLDRGGTIDADFGGLLWRAATLADRAPLTDEVRVHGSRGRVEVRKPEGTLRPFGLRIDDLQYGERAAPDGPRAAVPAVTDLLDAIEGRTPLGCTFEEARTSVRILEAAYESAASAGRWVDF